MENLKLRPMTVISKRGFYGTRGENEGKSFYVLDVTGSMKDKRSNFYGYGVDQIFLTREQWDRITPEDIGKQIVLEYGSDGYGKPVVTNIQFIDYIGVGNGKPETK